MNTYDSDKSEAQALFVVQLRSQGFASVTQCQDLGPGEAAGP
jgi:hypothetical protein